MFTWKLSPKRRRFIEKNWFEVEFEPGLPTITYPPLDHSALYDSLALQEICTFLAHEKRYTRAFIAFSVMLCHRQPS